MKRTCCDPSLSLHGLLPVLETCRRFSTLLTRSLTPLGRFAVQVTPSISESDVRPLWFATHVRVVLLVLLSLQVAGCFSRTGDFGRPETGPLREKVLPAFGKANARARSEPVSNYNHTDNEKLMNRRAIYLQNPPHVRDWLGRAVTELETTRVVSGFGRAHAPDRYYAFLRTDRFRSSQSRYERLKFDMTSDTQLIMPFYDAARAVKLDDRERVLATRRRPDLTAQESSNSHGRVHENNLTISQVGDALDYRLQAYRFAIDRMEIETPSNQILAANRTWRFLSAAILAGKQKLRKSNTVASQKGPHRRSRIFTGPFEDDGPVPQK